MKEKVMKSKKLLKASLALSLVFGSIVPTVVSASDFDTNDSEIYSIKKLISESNTQVRHDHSQIDTSDKSFEVNSGDASPFVSFASTRKEYTYKHFWWGTRFYFRSNAA